MPDKIKQALLEKLMITISFLGGLITYLSKDEAADGLEIKLLEHMRRLAVAYHEYKANDRTEAYLRSIFERERREFFAVRTNTGFKSGTANLASSPETAQIQEKVQELFKIPAPGEQCEELLRLAGSEAAAIEFLTWIANPSDDYLKRKPIYSMKFIIGAWARYEKEKPSDDEMRRLEMRAAKQNAAMQNAKGPNKKGDKS